VTIVSFLFPNYFDQNPFFPFPIEFPIKKLFPWSEIEFPLCDGYDDFASHDGSLQVGIGIVLVAVMLVLGVGLFRGELLQPDFEVLVESGLIVINEDTGTDVHGVDQAEAFLNGAFAQTFLDLGSNIHEGPALWKLEPEFFSERFHEWSPAIHEMIAKLSIDSPVFLFK